MTRPSYKRENLATQDSPPDYKTEKLKQLHRKREHNLSSERNPMKFYLASSFNLAYEVQLVHDCLVAAGHEVPDVWLKEDLKKIDLPDEEWYEDPRVKGIAERHWRSIEECDVFVIVCPAQEPKKFNGANVELGYAHALGKPIFSIGALERSAMYVPVMQVKNTKELLEAIDGE